ncbi:MAG: RidA family protein [SAR202 cluster bacterium]|nr:RidA family protein [SAR202 cluster bacterium]
MNPESKARELGIVFNDNFEKGYLNMVVNHGNLFLTSGHVSKIKGKLGDDLNIDQGYIAAKECAIWILQSLHQKVGSLNNIKVLKLFGMVNSTLDFTEQHLVINGASDLYHEIFGIDNHGYHARSAVGFAQLPTGVAVEIEAIFELIN